MYVTNKRDGIHILGHGVVSVSELVSGEYVLDPVKMRYALAKINRYAGNTEAPWNDAEHSILVADLTKRVHEVADIEELFLKRSTVVDTVKLWRWLSTDEHRWYQIQCMAYHWGMLHDAVEVIVGDTPNPVKQFDEAESVRRSGDTAEDRIVARIKEQQLGVYATRLAFGFTGGTDRGQFVASAILDLLQDFVKPADKLALLVEMHNMHDRSVLDYVYDLWEVNAHTKAFVSNFDWDRLQFQSKYEGIDWRNSARLWGITLHGSAHRLAQAFQGDEIL